MRIKRRVFRGRRFRCIRPSLEHMAGRYASSCDLVVVVVVGRIPEHWWCFGATAAGTRKCSTEPILPRLARARGAVGTSRRPGAVPFRSCPPGPQRPKKRRSEPFLLVSTYCIKTCERGGRRLSLEKLCVKAHPASPHHHHQVV
jgi:hypothetical protein